MATSRYASSIAILAGLSSAAAVYAEQLPARVFTVADGLAGNLVECIVQDSRGFIWFCTSEGLSRFDGYQFQTFGPDQGLPGIITALVEAGDGDYWVAGLHGVFRFNPAASGRSSPVEIYKTQPDFGIRALALDGAGGLWCGSGSGLYHLGPPNAGQWPMHSVDIGMPAKSGPGAWTGALLRDRSGVLWIGSPSGLYRLLPDGRTTRYTARDGLPHDHVISLLQDRQGTLWVGTWEGLGRITISSGRGDPYGRVNIAPGGMRSPHILSLLETSDGRLWAGTDVGVFSASSLAHPAFERHAPARGPLSKAIDSLMEDRLGNVWAALPGIGVANFSRDGFATYGPEDGLANEEIRAIFEDRQGELCAVTYAPPGPDPAHWVNCFDGRRFHPVRPNIPAVRNAGWGSHQVTFQDHTGEWWVPTGDGLFRFPADGLQFARPRPFFQPPDQAAHEETSRIFEDSRGNIWIGNGCACPARLTVWERATGKTRHYGQLLGARGLTAFAEDRTGNVWIGFTEQGLARYRAGRLQFFGVAAGLPEGWIHSLFLDSQGRLWVASSRNGIARVDAPDAPVPNFAILTTAQGLSSNQTRCITEDRLGRIYVGGAHGVDCFYPRAPLRIRHYTAFDGLPQAELGDAFRDRHGSLWFATSAGLARLDPQPEYTRPAPPILISALRVRGERRSIPAVGSTSASRLAFGSDQNQLQIDFVSPDFHPGSPIYYQYRLEDADADWSRPTEERTVNYATLPPGSYRFSVRAVTIDGVASAQPATLSFTILAPYWAQWWFRALVLLLAATGAYLAYRSRMKRLLAVERLRTRIATDLHDDIGASLSRIAIMSEVLIQRAGNERNGTTSQLADIARGAREMLASMSDIVWAINPSYDHLRDLTQRMRRFASDVLSARDIEFDFRAPSGQDLKMEADGRRQVFLVFKEAINNIARHSGSKRVEIELAHDRAGFVLRIEDDGKGLAAAATVPSRHGQGLESMRARAARLGGAVDIASQPDHGTSITLRIPLGARSNETIQMDGDRRGDSV